MKNIQDAMTNGSVEDLAKSHGLTALDSVAGEELIVQWHAAVETCKKEPKGFSPYEMKAIENFLHPEQLIDDLQKRQDQNLTLDANEVFSRVSPFSKCSKTLFWSSRMHCRAKLTL